MAKMFFILMAGFCILGVNAIDNLPLDAEEIRAIQDRLAQADRMEQILKAYLTPAEAEREEKCIPEGGECKFASGPNCCGISTRCNVFDTQIAQRGGPAKWLSKCRVYNAGAVAASVGDFFKNLG